MSKNPWEERKLDDLDEEHSPMTEQESIELDDDVERDEAPVNPEVEALQAKLEAMRGQVLSAHAEMENVRRRTKEEADKARKFAVEKVVIDLIPVLDSLDQALQNAAGDDPMAEGVQLTLKMLMEVLGRFGIKVINPQGEKFDPQHHEAMAMQPSADHEPNTVLTVLQKGFILHDRLIRPARVIVAKA